jgi:PAS domain S-box-containing protein
MSDSLVAQIAPSTHGAAYAVISFVFVMLAMWMLWLLWGLRRTFLRAELTTAQFQMVLDNMNEGIVVLNPDRTIALMNATGSRLMSLNWKDVSYATYEDQFDAFTPEGKFLPPEEWPSSRALRGDFVKNYEMVHRRKNNGEMGSHIMTTAPVPGNAGPAGQVILCYHDDSERRRVDEARMGLASIVEFSEDAIIGKDVNGIITSWNQGAEKMFGYTAEEMIGRTSECLLPPESQKEERDIVRRILLDETVHNFDTVRRTKNGDNIHISLTVSPIKDGSGRVIGASKIARNITATLNLENQLRQSQKMEAIGQLTGGIAHDFNNLLGIVIGNLDLLERDILSSVATDDGTALQRTQVAQRAAHRGADLTRRLLAFSSTEQLKPTPISLPITIRNIMEMASRAIGPEIEITANLSETLPLVLVDPSGLESALLNLMVNARDAMPNGGSLRIMTRRVEIEAGSMPIDAGTLRAGSYACISVSDNGVGMSHETMERAFEPFYTTKGRHRGSGLGLAMVYGFLRQSNGTVRLYSELGYGTTVSLYLPFAEPTARVMPEPLAAQPAWEAGGTVLLVDDEPDLLDISTTYLERMGYTVLRAGDGSQALRVLKENGNIDVMVTDIIMPGGMNGVELGRQVREQMPNTRVVYTSGFPADALAMKSLDLEGTELLHKPYRLAELGEVIRHALESQPPALAAD